MQRTLIALLAGLVISGCATTLERSASEIAFVNVAVVLPDANTIVKNQTVAIGNGRITWVGPSGDVRLHADTQIIAGQGRYLTPGLVEMHAHVPKSRESREYLEDMLFLWVANGITTIRNMNGEPMHVELREQIASGLVLGPRIFTAGPPFQGNKVKTAAEASAIVAEQAAAGYDFLKVHMALPLHTYEGVVAGAAEHDLDFAGHVSENIGLWRALDSGQKSIDHLESYMQALVAEDADVGELKDSLLGMPYTPFVDAERIELVAEATATAGVWNAPTLTLARNFIGPHGDNPQAAGIEYMPPKTVRGWQGIVRGFEKSIADPAMAQQFLSYRMQIVKALHDAGAGILLGSDAPQVLNVPGFSAHSELELLVASGLTPAEALVAGTKNPAIYFDKQDEFGAIATGLSADLVLVGENPLKDISAMREPEGVMLRGQWLSAAELAAGLERIAASYEP